MSASLTVTWPAADLKWAAMDGGPPGVMVVDLWGDHTKGAYGSMIKFPAGTTTPVHTHTSDMRVVIVSGTTGDASSSAFLISQRADIGRAGPVHVSLGYRLRWDRFNFHAGHKTVSRSGVLVAATDVASPEMTDSKVHELPVGFRAAAPFGGAWHLVVSGEISPITLARLSVQLPEKYPDQDLVFLAKVVAAAVRIALVRGGQRWPIEIALQAERTASYRSTDRLSRSAHSIAIGAVRAW